MLCRLNITLPAFLYMLEFSFIPTFYINILSSISFQVMLCYTALITPRFPFYSILFSTPAGFYFRKKELLAHV